MSLIARASALAAAVALLGGSITAFYQFADSRHWIYAVIFGVVIPVVTVVEWRAQYKRDPEACQAVEHVIFWLGLTLVALTATR